MVILALFQGILRHYHNKIEHNLMKRVLKVGVLVVRCFFMLLKIISTIAFTYGNAMVISTLVNNLTNEYII